MAGYALRPVRADDDELLYRVYASTRESELAVVPWSLEQKEQFVRMQHRAQHTHYQTHYADGTFEIVVVDGADAGRLYLHRSPREIRVVDVSLLPDFRGRGIGEQMFRDLFAEADRDGKVVSIHVEHQNPARRLYERLGFVVVDDGELTPIYLRMDRRPEPR